MKGIIEAGIRYLDLIFIKQWCSSNTGYFRQKIHVNSPLVGHVITMDGGHGY